AAEASLAVLAEDLRMQSLHVLKQLLCGFLQALEALARLRVFDQELHPGLRLSSSGGHVVVAEVVDEVRCLVLDRLRERSRTVDHAVEDSQFQTHGRDHLHDQADRDLCPPSATLQQASDDPPEPARRLLDGDRRWELANRLEDGRALKL